MSAISFASAHAFKQGERHDFNTVQAATFTLLALIIGFTCSMAVNRYDQCKTLEEAEANAMRTEYLRAGLLPRGSGARTRELLRKYLALRIPFYEIIDTRIAAEIGRQTASIPVALDPWLRRDALIAALDGEINTEADDGCALSHEQRQQREAEVMGDLLDIERQEAALVWQAQSQSFRVNTVRIFLFWHCSRSLSSRHRALTHCPKQRRDTRGRCVDDTDRASRGGC